MFQSPILDVGIGLILVFLIVALVCTSINEYIAQFLSLRAEGLYQAVCGLFQGAGQKASEDFAKQLFSHGLLNALSPPGKDPSYVPSHIFSLALTDVLGIHTPENLDPANTKSVADMLKGVPNVDPRIAETLRPLAVAAGNDLDLFRQKVEVWFDSAMQRAGGWYKKRIQVITVCVAFSVCLSFNLDAILIANTLWNNPTARNGLVADAPKIAPTSSPKPSNPPQPQAAVPTQGGVAAPATVATQMKDLPALNSAGVQQTKTAVLGLVGWSGPIHPQAHGYNASDPHRFPAGFDEWIGKLLGILVTVAAASLGAPFWFGVLNRVMSVRASGEPPADAAASSSDQKSMRV